MPNPVLKRRWFRFSLRTLFVVVTVFACWLGWEFRVVHERKSALQLVETRMGITESWDFREQILGDQMRKAFPDQFATFPSFRRLLGDAPIFYIGVPEESVSEEELDRLKAMFPEAMVGAIDLASLKRAQDAHQPKQ